MRSIIKPNDKNFELSIDSTPHIQTGLKMEWIPIYKTSVLNMELK